MIDTAVKYYQLADGTHKSKAQCERGISWNKPSAGKDDSANLKIKFKCYLPHLIDLCKKMRY